MKSIPIGELVRLREYRDADAPDIVAWRNDTRQWFFSDDVIDADTHRRFMRRRSGYYLVVERLADGTAVGTISLYNISHRHKRAEYGRFLIAPEERRKGYGEEALRLLLRFAFDGLGLFKVYGDLLSNNAAAIALDLKIGFFREALFPRHVQKDGKRRDVVRMAVFNAKT